MSIAVKQILMKNLEWRLGEILTADSLSQVLDSVMAELGSYEIELSKSANSNTEGADFLRAYLDAKQIEGRSEKTIKHYRYVLERMQREINVPIRCITVYHLRSYLAAQKDRGIVNKTLEGWRSAYCSYFGWLQKEGLLKENPCSNLNPIKCQKKVRQPYTDVDLAKLLEACKTTRDKAMISVLSATGCRISEVCGMNKSDIDFKNLECVVLGKGNKERTVYFDNVTAMLLQRYFEERKDKSAALFVGKGTSRMTPSGVRSRLKKLAKKAGLENVHPHRFRRTLATNLIDRGMPIQEVAAILGHDKLDTTMTYVYMRKGDIKNAYQKFC